MTSIDEKSLNPKILDKVKENSRKMTKFYDFAGIFTGMKNLVAPVSVNLKWLEFYDGNLAPEQDYSPEGGEHPEKHVKAVMLEDLLRAFKQGQISFVGSAGSGKTTLLKTITNGVLSQAYEGLQGIELVHFADVRNIGENEELTVGEYLFRNNEEPLTAEEKEATIQFARDNPEKVLFVIDSLDTLPYSPENGNTEMDIHDRKKPATILRCLLSDSLLPKCRFITSSREYAIKNFDKNLRARDVYGLAGLSTESMRKLATEYLDEGEADEMMTFLDNNPILKSLSATPLFLVLTLIVRKNKPGYVARSVAGILVPLLQLLIRTEFVHQKKIIDVLSKLENLSAKLTEEGRVLFTIKDLGEFDLSLDDVNDFSVTMPNAKYKKLILGEEVLFFVHQLIQEILTAFHVIKRCQDDYEDSLQLSIHTPRYSVIRRLVCGTLLDKDVFEGADEFFGHLSEEDVETKRRLLRWSVIEELASQSTSDMELALLLAESGAGLNDISLSHITRVSGGYSTLDAGRGHALGLLLRRVTTLQELDLSSCSPHTAGLENIHRAVHGADLQIDNIKISTHGMLNMGREKVSIVGKILNSCPTQMVHLGNSITVAEAVALATSLNDCVETKITQTLQVAVVVKEQLTPEDAVGLKKFVKMFVGNDGLGLNMEEKEFSNSRDALLRPIGNSGELSAKGIQLDIGEQRLMVVARLLSFLENFMQLEDTVRVRISLGSDRLTALGRIIKQHHVQNVTVYVQPNGQPTTEHWKDFERELDGFQMSAFKPMWFAKLGSEEMSVIGRILANNSEIDLSESRITREGLEAFQHRITDLKLKRLALQLERSQGCKSYKGVGEMIVKSRVQNLDLYLCEKVRIIHGSKKAFLNTNILSQAESTPFSPTLVLRVSATWDGTGLIAKRLELERTNQHSGIALTSANLAAFLKGIKSVKIVHIVMKMIRLTARSISEIAMVIQTCHVTKLELISCEITAIDSRPISELVEDPRDLTISVNGRYMGLDGVRGIGEMVVNCGACAFELKLDGLHDEHLHSLVRSFGFYKVSSFKLGFSHMNRWTIGSLVPILPCVSNKIDLSEWAISKEHRRLLQSERRRLGLTNLKLVFHGVPPDDNSSKQFGMGPKRTMRDIAHEVTGTPEKRIKLELIQESPSEGDSMEESDDASTTSEEFHLEDETPGDDDLEEMVKQNLTRPICSAKVIGKEGGVKQLSGSELKFSVGAFDEDTAVSMMVTAQDHKIPDGCIPISPAIKCGTSGVQFKGLATIKLPIHFKVDYKDIVILSKKSFNSQWMKVEATVVLDDDSVVFKVPHFCWFQAFKKKMISLLTGKVMLKNQVYYKPQTASLRILTCVDDKLVWTECSRALEKKGFISALEMPESVKLGHDERMRCKVDCQTPRESKIQPGNELSYSGEIFDTRKSDIARFRLDPKPGRDIQEVCVQYTLKRPKEDQKISALPLEWNVGNTTSGNFSTDVTAFVSDVDIRGSTEEEYFAHLADNEKYYRIDPGRKKGTVLIINNEFENNPQKRRNGSEVDMRNLYQLWKALGFDVTRKKNLTAQEIQTCCRKFADDANGVSAVVVIIMSHGGCNNRQEFFVGADEEKVLQKDIINKFSSKASKHLRGIPKLFMFQACRGSERDYESDDETHDQDDDEPGRRNRHPDRSDMLLAFPTQVGFRALRHRTEGSWLMNAVTNIFMKHAHDTHVLDMLTMVNKEVASKAARIDGRIRIQTSCQNNYFQKRLRLYPGWPQR